MDTKLEFKNQAMAEFNKETPDLSSITTGLQSHIEQMSSQLSENLTQFNTFYKFVNIVRRTTKVDYDFIL